MIKETEPATGTVALVEIEVACKDYAHERTRLAEHITAINAEIDAIRRRHLTKLKALVVTTAAAEVELRLLLESAPHLFDKPRTVVFHGVKVGYQKAKGGIVFEDADKVVDRIHKLYPENWADLLIVAEKPDKAALNKLSVCELKKLGCEVAKDTDEVVIKPTDSEIDKAVNALLKAATEETL